MLYDDLEVNPLYDVSCALPDLQWVVYAAIGAVVIVAALGVAIVYKLRRIY